MDLTVAERSRNAFANPAITGAPEDARRVASPGRVTRPDADFPGENPKTTEIRRSE